MKTQTMMLIDIKIRVTYWYIEGKGKVVSNNCIALLVRIFTISFMLALEQQDYFSKWNYI